ncbi:MAG: TetR/AcrR family transcriptional regulator [Chitinispirillales bacterium]|nr:TetR/AcrR family transcriptional regulator [Chitinispirillales bacterium]
MKKTARLEAVNSLKQNLIMDAALKVVIRDGYLAAKLEDIAEEAGFSKAALYHYFPDKEALFLNLIIREQQSAYERCLEIVERDLPFLETLKEVISVTCQSATANAKQVGFTGESPFNSIASTLATMLSKHEDLFKIFYESKETFTDLFSQVVDKAKKAGVLTIQLENKIISNFIGLIIQAVVREVHENCLNGVQYHDINKTIDGLLMFFKPWINNTQELVPAEGEVSRA